MVQEARNSFFSSDVVENFMEVEDRPFSQAEALLDWAVNKSWSYCLKCKLLQPEKLLPSFPTSKVKTFKACPCTSQRYHIPQAVEIPLCLRGLNTSEILALRPFTLHNGNYKVHKHGYRQKDGFTRVSWSEVSVLEKISKLDSPSQVKCMLAYRNLTTSPRSRYNHVIEMREQHVDTGKQVNLYDYRENDGIECTLWPHLYPIS